MRQGPGAWGGAAGLGRRTRDREEETLKEETLKGEEEEEEEERRGGRRRRRGLGVGWGCGSCSLSRSLQRSCPRGCALYIPDSDHSMPPFVKAEDSAVQNPAAKQDEEVDPFRNPEKESLVMLCNVGQAVMGFIICIIGAAYSYVFKFAFIMLGMLMLGAGIAGAVFTTKRSWTMLFVAMCVHGFTCVLLLILLIMAGLMAFDVRDPVTEAVENTWVDMRPELEAAEFCTSVPDKQRHCQLFQDWAAIATQPVVVDNTTSCPWTTLEMAQNCTRAWACEDTAIGTHVSECTICDNECKGVLLDELRGNISYVALFFDVVFWGLIGILLFNIRLGDISSDVDDWNEFMASEAKKRGVEEYTEEDLAGTLIHKLGMLVNLCLALTGLICSIIAVVILVYSSDFFSTAAWGIFLIGLALTSTGGALFYGAFSTTTMVLKIGNYLLALFTAMFLFFSVLLSMTTGDVSDLHQSVEEEWPNTQIKLERDEPGYCRYPSGDCNMETDANQCIMASDECKNKFIEEVQGNVTNMFVLVFLEMGFLVVLILLTNDVVSATLSCWSAAYRTLP